MTIHKYRVRVGFTYGPFDEYKSGDIVELDDSTAMHNLDKLELAEILPPPPSTLVVPVETAPEEVTDETGIEQPILPSVPKRTLRKPKAGD